VILLLLDIEFKDITGPLAQFQAKKVERAALEDVINSINQMSEVKLQPDRLAPLFEALWTPLEKKVAEIPKTQGITKQTRTQHEVLEELVSTVRGFDLRFREIADDGPPRRHIIQPKATLDHMGNLHCKPQIQRRGTGDR